MTNEEMINALTATGQYQIQSKLPFKRTYNNPKPGVPLKKATMLDVETTGLNALKDEITNLAMFQFTYDDTGTIYSIVDFYDGFREPSIEIPERVQKMTGITPELCKGKSLNMKKIESIFSSSEFIIAHNAQFDRSFVDRLIPVSKDAKWCCTQKQIPWDDIGAVGTKLVTIAVHYGFWYDAHQAKPDCLAGIEILSRSENDKANLSYLIESVAAERYIVRAVGSPYESRFEVKDAGYSWQDNPKMWFKLVDAADVAKEKAFLDTIYPKGRNTSVIELFDRKDLFK